MPYCSAGCKSRVEVRQKTGHGPQKARAVEEKEKSMSAGTGQDAMASW